MKPTCRQIGLCDMRVTAGVCVSLSNELSNDESTDENPYRLSTSWCSSPLATSSSSINFFLDIVETITERRSHAQPHASIAWTTIGDKEVYHSTTACVLGATCDCLAYIIIHFCFLIADNFQSKNLFVDLNRLSS